MTRRVLVFSHPSRRGSSAARDAAEALLVDAGLTVVTDPDSSDDVEVALVLGGDGTMLNAAHAVRTRDIPLFGVNLGRVGFLTELDRDGVSEAVTCIAEQSYHVEERATLEWAVTTNGDETHRGWALNDVTVERQNPRRILEVGIAVDSTVLSTLGCDAVVMSSATGSTAHAFSAGGPVVWPDVAGMVLVPIAAHALFSRPLVVGTRSAFAVQVLGDEEGGALAVADGARTVVVAPGGTVEVRMSDEVVRLASVEPASFTERLITKFQLPTEGWRGERARWGKEAP